MRIKSVKILQKLPSCNHPVYIRMNADDSVSLGFDSGAGELMFNYKTKNYEWVSFLDAIGHPFNWVFFQ